MNTHNQLGSAASSAPALARELRERLSRFVSPLLRELDFHLDARLVRTFAATLEAILCHRNRAMGLLLSELGAYILSPEQAPAGTKRLSNLLRSPKWNAKMVGRYLWRLAEERLREIESAGEEALVLWDASVLEKPESIRAEGLCSVRSSKAARLKRIKPGFFTPPCGPPVFVPGLQWLALLLTSPFGRVQVATMQWWTKRDAAATDLRTLQTRVLGWCAKEWKRRVLHVFDRGYAGRFWLNMLLFYDVRFLLRWPKHYHLLSPSGEAMPAWQIARGKRNWEERPVYDTHQREQRNIGILALPVRHPQTNTPLWLVIGRAGGGREPWYLLTNEAVQTKQEAWRIYFAYHRRWQVEMSFRFNKSELAMESPRLWTWEGRLKMLAIVTLCYAFLLSLLLPTLQPMVQTILRFFCHRTGKRSREASAPLYRLRSGISRLWLAYPRTLDPVHASAANPG